MSPVCSTISSGSSDETSSADTCSMGSSDEGEAYLYSSDEFEDDSDSEVESELELQMVSTSMLSATAPLVSGLKLNPRAFLFNSFQMNLTVEKNSFTLHTKQSMLFFSITKNQQIFFYKKNFEEHLSLRDSPEETCVRAIENERSLCEVLPSTESIAPQSEDKAKPRRKRLKFRKNKVGCLNERPIKKKKNFFTRLFSCILPWKRNCCKQ